MDGTVGLGQARLGWRAPLKAGLDGAARAFEAAAALVLAVLFGVVMLAVAHRYILGGGLVWSDELAVWLHVALVAIGAPVAASGALGLRLEVVARMLPAGGQRAAAILADAVTVAGALVLLRGGATVVELLGGTSTVLGLPEWLRYAVFAAGGAATIAMILGRAAVARGLFPCLLAAGLGVALYALTRHPGLILLGTPSLAAGLVAAAGLLSGAPLPFSLLLGVASSAPFGGLLPEPAIVQNTVSGISKFLLLAIPFFLLAGELLTAGGLAQRLVRFAASMVGHLRAGMAQTALVSSVLFSGASGSSVANAAFGAKVMAPALVERGYPPPKAAAIVAAVSMLDNIIPPSIAFLLLAAATNLSVGSLLVGGFVAGGVLAAALALGIHLTVRGTTDRLPRASGAERTRGFVEALPAIGLGGVIVLGIRAGLVTTTEASALAVLYALVASLALGGIAAGGVADALRKAAIEAAAVGLLIGSAAPFAFLLAVDRVSAEIASWATLLGGGPFAVMLVANVILLVVGVFLDIGAAILLLGPLLVPVAAAAGIDPIHFGVVLVVNLMIHGLTPPLGILVYVVAGITRVPAGAVFRAVLPLLGVLLLALAILAVAAAAWPGLHR